MRRHLILLAVAALAAGPARAARWYTFENCQLIPNPANDGDSFHVRYKSRHYIFRLYFVDAPESEDSLPDRVQDQAAYWGIDGNASVRLGKQAAEFTRKFLEDGFTVYTERSDARGRSDRDRFYAFIKAGDQDLAEALVRNGLARIYGVELDHPDGTSATTYLWRLKTAERQAKQDKIGGWAKQTETAADRLQQMTAVPQIAEQELVLPRTIALYSLKPPYSQVALLQKGAAVTVLQAESPTLVRIRFRAPSGNTYEAQCRRIDLGL